MRSITVAERRARLGRRHLLAAAGPNVTEAADAMVGLHSSDPATVYLAAWARVDRFTHEDLDDALYEERSLVRMLGMRRTLFVLPVALAPLVQRGCTDDLIPAERRKVVRRLESHGIAEDGERWLAQLEIDTLAALHAAGEAFTSDLTRTVPGLATKITFAEGTKWEAEVVMSSRVLFLLAAAGRVVRARPRASWVGSHYRWAPTTEWLGAPIAEMDPAGARAALLHRWLHAFGPGTIDDIKWWTGWTLAKSRAALSASDAVSVATDGAEAFVAVGDEDQVEASDPWVALLPGLDPTTMGWTGRRWYLGENGAALFDRNGNAGPTIWSDGRVVGGWAQRADAKVVYRLLEDVGAETEAAIADQAGSLERWLDGTVVSPRFRTPLERELSGR
jgi:hypothetical protein